MLQKKPVLATIGFDTAENEPRKEASSRFFPTTRLFLGIVGLSRSSNCRAEPITRFTKPAADLGPDLLAGRSRQPVAIGKKLDRPSTQWIRTSRAAGHPETNAPGSLL